MDNLYKADNGSIIFARSAQSRPHQLLSLPCIYLIGKECPHKVIYKFRTTYSRNASVQLEGHNILEDVRTIFVITPNSVQKYWLSWYNDTIQMGEVVDSICLEPFFKDTLTVTNPKLLIGFVRFESTNLLDWFVESSSICLKPICHKNIEGGKLRWAKILDNKLPHDALVGGYENELIYIARALHNGSLCPGKYVPTKQMAYVPWGGSEHEKNDFEILCGFDAIWVKCKEDFVPENAFIAGTSEVRRENLYIGRTTIDNEVIVGKVHMLHKTCYLPYKGKEVEVYTYEILVKGDVTARGETRNANCLLNPLKANQPCI